MTSDEFEDPVIQQRSEISPALEHQLLADEIAKEHAQQNSGGEVYGRGTLLGQMWRVYRKNTMAVISTFYMALIIGLTIIVPFFFASDYWEDAPVEAHNTCFNNTTAGTTGNAAPSLHHLLGCTIGFDNVGWIFYSGRYSLMIGALASLVTMTVGVVYGVFSGFRGGKIDVVMMRILDVLLSIPGLYLLLLIITIYGQNLWSLVLVIGATGWFGVARLLRGEAQVIREREYVQASTSMGATRRRLMFRHILPNGASTIVTAATFSLGDAVLTLAGLGYLGFGLQPPQADWGTIINNAAGNFINGEWWTLWPLAVIFILFVLATNYIGDALRDAFEVRLQER